MHVFFESLQQQVRCVTRATTLLGIFTLSGCASSWPDIDTTPTAAARAAPEPELLTGPQIDAALGPNAVTTTEQATSELADRVAALKARAAQLDGGVLSASETRRLREAACARDPSLLECRAAN